MDKNLKALSPAAVWKHFERIAAIPHPSHHEEKIRRYILDFAAEHGLEHVEDEAHNVYIRKPATKGMENRKGIIMQAHLDMVPQKNNDKQFDFENDPIEAYIDGEWVTANGTTLGADNGIGVAAALAVLEDENLEHGDIEALFTATEETGMDGAFGLKAGLLKGEILLNLDSETEGELYVGCAGGLDANIEFKYAEQAIEPVFAAYRLSVKGLKGGHSGIQIVCQRANANKLLFRLLRQESLSYGLELASVDGGGLRNAIPREATAVVVMREENAPMFEANIRSFEAVVRREFAQVEDSISITAERVECPTAVIPRKTASDLVRAVCGCPNGVIYMSKSMEGLVQTSSNLARVVSDGSTIRIQCLLRSSVDTQKAELAGAIASVFELAGAEVRMEGAYSGWNPDMSSPILHTMIASYEALYGVEPSVTAIHAGLECGIIGAKYPGMDMISFGPTICYPHSPDEKVDIASVGKFYDFLLHTLRNAPSK